VTKPILWLVLMLSPAANAQPVPYNGKQYFVVDGSKPKLDTGNAVCRALKRTCVGYTADTLDICHRLHPTAAMKLSVHGSRAGFYCDGKPQTGPACAPAKTTCEICPTCNVNADCDTHIGLQFREMYVECGAGPAPSPSPSSAAACPPPPVVTVAKEIDNICGKPVRYSDTGDGGDDPWNPGCHWQWCDQDCTQGKQLVAGDECTSPTTLMEWMTKPCHTARPDTHLVDCDEECKKQHRGNGHCATVPNVCAGKPSAKCECEMGGGGG
jgi:hypothetical protein